MKKSIFLFFAAILCAMSANAYNQSAVDLYFDNSEAKWSSCYVYIGHTSHTCCYPMTRVSGTQYLWKLAKADFNGGNSWGGASGWVVCKEKWWDKADESIYKYTWHGTKNVTKIRTSAWSASYIYKTNGTTSVTSDGNTIDAYNTTTYSKKDYAVTINTATGGTLTVKDYDNQTVATGASKIHLTVLKFSATPADGYVLDGVEINDGTNTTTIAAADLATKTHTLTSAVTITPVWRATTSTVTVTATATNGTVTGGGVVEEGTSVTLTATPADGYKFVNWTVGGAEVSTANPYTFTAEEDVTVVANFEELPKTTVYFVNTLGWTDVKAYAYSPANASWPGVAATKEAEKIGDFDVYSYTATEGKYANVIFNGNGGQTADLTWSEGVDKYYIHGYNGNTGWYTKAEAEAILVVPVEYDYVYLINTNDWAKAYIYTWTPTVAGWPGAAMTKEAEQIAGKDVYSYKVVKGTTFGGLNFNCGGDECKTGDLTWQAGKYYAPSKDKWYDDAAAAAADLAVNTYTVVGSSAPLFGTAWAPELTANDMALVEGTKYQLVKSDVNLAVGEIKYKVAVNHAWTESYPATDAVLNIAEAGKYTITFTFDSNTKAVNATAELTEAAVVLPTVGVKGAWDGWAATTTLTGDNTSASATVNIATAGIYEFGLDVDGNFQASGATIDKANNSTVVTTNAGNMKLKANVLGDYTFTWTYETNTLTVTYPAGEEVDLTPKYYIAGTQNLTGFDWKENGLEIAKDGEVYKHTFSEMGAGIYEFKITDGTWTNSWGFSNLAANYVGVTQGVDGEGNPNGNIIITTEEAKNIIVIFDPANSKITLEGWEEAAPAEVKCYLMGIGGDWTTGIEMEEDGDQFKLLCQPIAEGEQFKFKHGDIWSDGVENHDFPGINWVDDDNDGNSNITLPAGNYNFYYKKATNQVYIEAATDCAIEITEVYDITITNLETEVPQPGFLALLGSESEELGLSVQLFLNDYTGENKEYQLNEASYLTCFAGELTFVSGSMTQADDATSGKTYTGKVIAELQGMYFQFNLTMYKKQLPTETLAITGAELVVDLWNNINVTAVYNASPVIVQFSDFEYVASKEYTYLTLEMGEWVDEDEDGICDNANYIYENISEATVTISGSTFTLKSKFEGAETIYDLTITGTLPLIVGEGDNSSVLAADGQNKNVYVTRAFESGVLYTVSFPFALSQQAVKDIFGSRVELYEYTSLAEDNGELVLNFSKLATPAIVAGKPYLMKPNKESYGFGLKDVTISSTTVPVSFTTAGTTITMQSVLTASGKTNGTSQYWLAEDNNLYNKSVNLKGLRAIFNVQTNKSNVRARAAFNENVETGVEDIFSTDTPVKVIVNGQLIIIRDGVKYNVQGQKL